MNATTPKNAAATNAADAKEQADKNPSAEQAETERDIAAGEAAASINKAEGKETTVKNDANAKIDTQAHTSPATNPKTKVGDKRKGTSKYRVIAGKVWIRDPETKESILVKKGSTLWLTEKEAHARAGQVELVATPEEA